MELHGSVDTLNATAGSFVLRGITVTYGTTTEFDDGTAANLAVGANLEVRGTLSSTGNTVTATRIKFDH